MDANARRGVIRAIAARHAALRADLGAGADGALLDDAFAGRFGSIADGVGAAYQWLGEPNRRATFAAARHDGQKIDAAGVVRASRIYTPAHIVDFLLQNSLGAWWRSAHPESQLGTRWPLLVRAAVPSRHPARPARTLRLLDPCCGCGAFLVAAFDMFAQLYADERALADAGHVPGDWPVEPDDVPGVIVRDNLHGADLDVRAVAILTRLLRERAGGVDPANLLVAELPLGSLDAANWPAERFDVVCANPPYVGFRMLAPEVKDAVRQADPLARSDLAVAFQRRSVDLLAPGGLCATVTPAAWLTGREALPLREHILAGGGPRVTVALGQRVFTQAPLLFVALSVVERGEPPQQMTVLRPRQGGGAEALAAAVAAGGDTVARTAIERLPLRPFLPGAPTQVLTLAGRGPNVGDLFTLVDGIWTGDNARDTRYWWEVDDGDGWERLSGGQGNEAWSGPTRLRIAAHHAAGRAPRNGAIEYARVAGGRLAARIAEPGTVALAGIISLLPDTQEAHARIEEVLAVFNSRVGAAWLRTLTSGLNFNPGYAARIPLAPDPPGPEVRDAVRQVVSLKEELVTRDPTADTFVDTVPPWCEDRLLADIAMGEERVEALLAVHLGLPPSVLSVLAPVSRPVRRVDELADHLGVRVLAILGARWPRGGVSIDDERVRRRGATPRQLATVLHQLLAAEDAPDLELDLERWVERTFTEHHRKRFRNRPIVEQVGGRLRLRGREPYPRAGR